MPDQSRTSSSPPIRKRWIALGAAAVAGVALVAIAPLFATSSSSSAGPARADQLVATVNPAAAATHGSSALPAATIYRADAGTVDGHSDAAIEIGVRHGRIRWVVAAAHVSTGE